MTGVFMPFSPATRINLAVVALGDTPRLRASLASLVTHQSVHAFTVTCVINPAEAIDRPIEGIPEGIHVLRPAANLGWAGGLHAARRDTDAEFLGWVQEDMVVNPGWLDAHLDAAEAHPEGGLFGAVTVGADGTTASINAGDAVPFDDVAHWNDSDRTATELADVPREYDWVTSKGALTRLAAWDELGGLDPRYFPLNHADKDFCTHLRAHGWKNLLVPNATLRHEGSTSSPSFFREYLAGWQEPRFNARWSSVVEQLTTTEGPVAHQCGDWRDVEGGQVELAIAIESSRLLVPFARAAAERGRRNELAALERGLAERDAARQETENLLTSTSWAVTRPLRAIGRWMRPKG
jgi:GT2 family glycosyltransferase